MSGNQYCNSGIYRTRRLFSSLLNIYGWRERGSYVKPGSYDSLEEDALQHDQKPFWYILLMSVMLRMDGTMWLRYVRAMRTGSERCLFIAVTAAGREKYTEDASVSVYHCSMMESLQ